MRMWMRRRVVALVLVAVMLVSYLPKAGLTFALDLDGVERWEMAQGTEVSPDMVVQQFKLGKSDTWQILGPSPSEDVVMSKKPLINGDSWTPKEEGTYTIQRYENVSDSFWFPKYEWKEYKQFRLVFSGELTETAIAVAHTDMDFDVQGLNGDAILKGLEPSVTTGGKPVADAQVKLQGDSLNRTIQSKQADGSYSYEWGDKITKPGSYRVVLVFAQTERYQMSTLTVDFTVTDNRVETQVLVKENAQLSYVGQPITTQDILKEVLVGVQANGALVEGAKVELQSSLLFGPVEKWSESLNKFVSSSSKINTEGRYRVTMVYAGDQAYKPAQRQVEFTVVDSRLHTTIEVEHLTATVTYGSYTTQDVMDQLGKLVVRDSNGAQVSGANVTVMDKVEGRNAGTHTLTLVYEGSDRYRATTTEVTLVVEKAKASVSVKSGTARYGDEIRASKYISVSPDVDHVQIVAGFGMGDDVTSDGRMIVYVNLPNLVKADSLPILVRPLVQGILDRIGNGATMSVGELTQVLNSLSGVLESVSDWVDLGIDKQTVKRIIDTLNTIQKLEFVKQVQVRLTMGKDVVVEDAGMYLMASVVSDTNYTQSFDVGGLLVLPKGKAVNLDFDYHFPYGMVTRNGLLQGEKNLGAHVVGVPADDPLNSKVGSLYFGLTTGGSLVLSTQPSQEMGAYTQISYLAQLGNQMVYALPIMRAYAVVPDTVTVKFDQSPASVVYDGQPHGRPAQATDGQGRELDEQYFSYYYMGVQRNGETYFNESPPVEAGSYTVAAAYVGPDNAQLGMGLGSLEITPAPNQFSLEDTTVTVNGEGQFVQVNNPQNVDYIAAIADEAGHVNLILPKEWKVEQEAVNLSQGEEGVVDYLWSVHDLPHQDGLRQALRTMLNELYVKSVVLNGPLPQEEGIYQVAAVAFGDNYQVAYDRAVLTLKPMVEPTVPPTEQPVEPTVPPTEQPVEPTVPPTEQPVEPTVPPTEEPVEPTVPPTEEPVEPTVPPTEEPVEPTVPPTEQPVEPTVPPTQQPSHKDELKKLVDQAQNMVDHKDKYVELRWQELVDALKAGQAVLADQKATDDQIQTAAKTLLDAILAQRFKADKSVLGQLVDKAQALSLEGYTAQSVAEFHAALSNAQAVLADESLTEEHQGTVNDTVAALDTAMRGLTTQDGKQPLASEPPVTTDKPQSSQQPGTTQKPEGEAPAATGDRKSVTAWVVLLGVSAGVLVCVNVYGNRRRINR